MCKFNFWYVCYYNVKYLIVFLKPLLTIALFNEINLGKLYYTLKLQLFLDFSDIGLCKLKKKSSNDP